MCRKSRQERSRARQVGTRARYALHQIAGCIRRKVRIKRRGCVRPGVAMSKHEPTSPLAFASASGNLPGPRGDAESAGGQPVVGEIGFVGLDKMGAAMAANLTAAGRRIAAYVRRPDLIGWLEALGLKPTTDPGDLLDCKV